MLKPYQKAELTFDIIKEIGQDGQNSKTYITRDHQLDAEIVTKQILKSKLNSPTEFFAESQALYASAHPNVVQVHYACFDADHVYIAMPYYQKGSVKGLMATRFLTVREIVILGTQTLSGLHNIHSKDLVHFDVKPDNILLSPRGEALVSDFGQAKQMNFSGIAAQDRHYGKMIPPEATVTDHFDRSFDIYQVGLTLYRMANGNDHFNQQFAKYGPPATFDKAAFRYDLRNGKFPDRSSFLPHIPSTLRNVIRKCLQVDPKDRYGSAIDVANAMAGIDGPSLDWCYAPQGTTRLWTKNKNGTKYDLTVNPDGSSVCLKSVNGGKARRVGDACKTKITDPELKKLFGSH
ncbi:serine/threonine-protein kinase [Bradyrhizobium sp. OK095]|uniref:serine/threonine-protein kinase n=1 Tax=Bradyrhizobium sp. OK095 TaxID=1882760 RepID=UPI0008C9CDDC|nr:serine/threonine-protein kinase [Bradyrhizobium sp. OK095]SEM97649.1 serine/threonine protein kinase [Bradyrhizobium sp. OK095]